MKDILRDVENTMRDGNKHLIRESQTKRKEKKKREDILQEIMADNFSSLMRKIQI